MNLHKITFGLLIIGGIAWGLEVVGFGLANYLPEMVMTVIYALVALSALYELFSHKDLCRTCSTQGAM